MSRFPSRPRRALSALMLAWAGTWLSQPLWAQEPLAAEEQEQTGAPDYGQIPEDVLARTIEAELAAQSGQFQRALRIYSALAAETNNLSIIQRAMRIAGGLRDVNTALDMGRRWLALEPDAVEPRQSMALQLVLSSRYGEAFDFLASLLEDGLDVDFRLISSAVARDPNASLYLDALINEFAALSRQFPDQQSLQLSLAHLYQLNDQTREALTLVEKLADELDDTPEVVMLEAELLERLGETNRAQRRLAQSLRDHPDHKELRLRYARKLLEARNFKEAKKQFAELAAQNPRDYDILYSLALLSLEENLLSDAKNYLQRLVQSGQRLDDAYYYLGYIAAQENDIEAAIEHYRRVRSGANFLPALRNFTELMVRTNRYSEAKGHLQNLRFRNPDLNLPLLTMEANVLIDQKQYIDAGTLLNSAVGAFPDNVQLLFLRSVLSQETNDLELMEKDLRRIIELNPDNPVAYNSLGYILADRTQRYQEAYELIKKAVELAPDDPAIIDSLGWVQYRLGMLDEARINLDRAYQLYPDHEVAAHLGEVMWMQGDRSAATRLWRRALEEQPDSEYIRQTMQRLGASP